MANTIKRHISHIKSSGGTAPVASNLIFGEIAVGYKAGEEALYILDSNSAITEFNPTTTVLALAETYTDKRVISTVSGTTPISVSLSPIEGDTTHSGRTLTVSHSTAAGYKHVPSGGSSGQFLGWDSAGTAKWVNNPNTDTKVTAVGNHYTPSATTVDTKTASANGGSALAWSSSIVTGVTLSGDAKGHITAVAVSSAKLPANPNSWRAVNVNNNQKYTTATTAANVLSFTSGSTNGTISVSGTDVKVTGFLPYETGLTSTSDAKIPTSKAVATYVTSQMAKALTYKGAITSNDTLKPPYKTGDVWVVSSAGTYAGKACEVGDYLIANKTVETGDTVVNADWDAINGENQVENSGITLSWGTTSSIAKVDGTVITLGLPANPNTDTATTFNGHYAPTATTPDTKTASANGGSALAWSSSIVTGITLSGDAKGHITAVAVSSAKLPANPNVDTKVAQASANTNSSFPILVKNSANNTAETASTKFATGVTINTSANTITAVDFIGKISGHTVAKDVPSNAEFTDTKVTSVDNHYTPASSATITKTASSSTNATWGSSDFVTGITLYKDAKGHITDMAVSSLQLPTPTTSAFTTVSVVGASTVSVVADQRHDTITFDKDDAIKLTGDATNDKVTFGLGNIVCGDYA